MKLEELTLEEVHSVELGLLNELDCFCEEHGLVYYLAYGSLLGAIRHGGPIPWDDDADVWMPREHFDSLMQLYDSNNGFRLIQPYSDGYPFSWAKILDTRTTYCNPARILPSDYGLTLDIFPLDADLGKERFKSEHRKSQLRTLLVTKPRKQAKYYWLKNTVRAILLLLRADRTINNPNSLRRCDNSASTLNSGYYVNYFSPYSYEKERLPTNYFDAGVRVPYMGAPNGLNAPKESERILEQLYGNNWRQPVKCARHAHFYWKNSDRSYEFKQSFKGV